MFDLPDFPNGFESWQRTHFEVVEVLCYIRELEEAKRPVSFAEMADRTASRELYELALNLTNKFEAQWAHKPHTGSLFNEIEEFVWSELQAQGE